MTVIRYSDFDLQVEAAGEGCRARVLKSPAGEASVEFDRPFSEADLRNFLGELGHPRGIGNGHHAREAEPIDRMRNFGGRLFESAFGDEVGECFRGSLSETSARRLGLRIRLHLGQELADIPWEYLYHRQLDRFFCLSVETPIVRTLDIPERVRVVKVKPPLRVLVMISAPTNFPPLDVEGEWAKLNEALKIPADRGLVVLERLDDASLVSLHDRLMGGEYHVFHFVGHGGFNSESQGGVLLMEGDGDRGVVVPGEDLGVVLHDHSSLRLAILNACEGARGSALDPFAGTAQALLRQRVPAVVAMQFEISDDAAKTLAGQFYSALSRGYPVDAALAEARKTIFLQGNRAEWATPVLYMRSPNGRIFDIEGERPPEPRVADVDPLAPSLGARPSPTTIVAEDKRIDVDHAPGAVVTPAPAGERPIPRLRRPPIDLRPKDFPGLLGRDAEVKAAAGAFLARSLAAEPPVEVFGPPGVGKTAFLRNMAHHPTAQFPDGVVYTSSRQPPPDLLQFLFQTFYESTTPVKPTEAELRRCLHTVEALVELDDLRLAREDVESLTNVAPSCLFLLASEGRILFEEGPGLALKGLSESAALSLLERRLGRAVADAELADARALCAAVAGHPLALVQAASRVRDGGVRLKDVARQATEAAGAPAIVDPRSLSEPERGVAAVLHAAGAPVTEELLAASTGFPDVGLTLSSLQARGVAQAHSPRFSLTEPAARALEPSLDAAFWAERALAAFTDWAEENRGDPYRLVEEADALLGILAWAMRNSRWRQAVRLGRAIEGALAVAGRWSRWRTVLEAVRESATSMGDLSEEAWALHQLGTRAIGLGDVSAARELLVEALRIRRDIGDRAGEQVTRQNLEFAGGEPPVEPSEKQPPEPPDGGGGGRPWLRLFGFGLLAAVVVVAAIRLWPRDGPPPPPPAGEAVLLVDAELLRFGDQEVDTPSLAESIVVTSDGSAPLEIGEPRIEGSADDFDVSGNTCEGVTLDPGLDCTIQVVFTPSGPGSRGAILVVDHNGEGNPLEVRLRGIGVTAGNDPVLIPHLSVDPLALRFAKDGELRQITVTSDGDATAEDLQISIDPPTGEFEITSCPGDLGVGSSCVIDVTFRRVSLGTGIANLVIASNAGDPIVVPMSGTPVALIEPLEPRFVDDTATVTVTNIGTATLTFAEVSIVDEVDPPEFRAESACKSLAIDEACTITVFFEPATFEEGTHTATLTIFDNSQEEPHEVPLSVFVSGVD